MNLVQHQHGRSRRKGRRPFLAHLVLILMSVSLVVPSTYAHRRQLQRKGGNNPDNREQSRETARAVASDAKRHRDSPTNTRRRGGTDSPTASPTKDKDKKEEPDTKEPTASPTAAPTKKRKDGDVDNEPDKTEEPTASPTAPPTGAPTEPSDETSAPTSPATTAAPTGAPTPPLPKVLECGGTIDTDTKLQKDLLCDCPRGDTETFVALTLVGPATLNMNGHTVACKDNSFYYSDMGAVIKVVGKSAVLKNGAVRGGNFGVWLVGQGRHKVKNMVVAATGNDAVLLTSSNNKVDGCDISDCGQGPDANNNGDCVDIEGVSSGNTVTYCDIADFGDDGLDIDGSQNTISNNRIQGSSRVCEAGISSRGSGNTIVNNQVSGMTGTGIELKYDDPDESCGSLRGGNHVVSGNTVSGSKTKHGIEIKSDGNTVSDNQVYGNAKDGIRIESVETACPNGGRNNQVLANESHDNSGDGFHMEGHDNQLQDNTAHDNQGDGYKDRGDGNEIDEDDNSADDNGDEDFDLE